MHGRAGATVTAEMGPYRTPAEMPPPRREAPPAHDREDLIVHAVMAVVGAIGVTTGALDHDLHAGFALALLLLVLGVRGLLRPAES